jgi:hypothetical protein
MSIKILMNFMIPRIPHALAGFVMLSGLAILTIGCQKVPLLAPGGSSITLIAPVTIVPLNGSVEIIAQVIEPAGTPPQRGTLVSFTTSLGTLQPSERETDTAGRASVRFLAGNGSGTATITALSGGVSVGTNTLRLLVGTAAVGSVRLNANPTLLPAFGGTSTITAQTLDVNGNPLNSAPVTFSTTAGVIDQTFATTDQNGLATTTLRTSTTATVTAAVGVAAGSSTAPPPPTTPPPTTTTPPPSTPATPASSGTASGTITVSVSSAPTLTITPPTTPPGEGLPATFTIAVAPGANGSAIREVTVDWGDGSVQSLGVVTTSVIVSHIFSTARTYQVVARATDAFGNVVSQSTTVTVIPVALPTVNITPSVPTTPSNPTNVTFNIQVTPPTGVNIRNGIIDYGDGIRETLGGVNGTIVKQHQYTHSPGQSFTISLTVEDTLGRFTTGTTTIVIP